MRYRHSARALTLWIGLALSAGCASYRTTSPSALDPGRQKIAVTLRQPRVVAEGNAAGSGAPVTRVVGWLERVSGDTLFVRVTAGSTDGGRPVTIATRNAPLAIAVADVEKIEARRFRWALTALAIAGGLFVFVMIAIASTDGVT